MKARWARPDDWEDLRDPIGNVTRTLEADRAYEEEQAQLKDKEKALEEGQPVPNPLRDGQATLDRWD